MQKEYIKNFDIGDLEKILVELGEAKYKAEQVFRELFAQRRSDFSEMTTISKDLRNKLDESYTIDSLEFEKMSKSSDGTRKLLFKLDDAEMIETVLIPDRHEKRLTICISSQVGCAMKCEFCATGTLGLKRNLKVAEILDQFLLAEKYSGEKITNIVFMGMGEPLQNYENVCKAIEILTHDKLDIIGAKRITVSTVGLAHKIKQIADEGRPFKLALSLHATTDNNRSLIVPMAKKWSLRDLGDALEYYYRKTKNPITYEYIVFENLNSSFDDAKRLAKITRRVPSKVNLIPFHDISFTDRYNPELELVSATKEKVQTFAEQLRSLNVAVFVRDSAGHDIDAACGQLAISHRDDKNA